MPEKQNDKTIFTLLEVTTSIRKTLEDRYKTSFWVKAEMNRLNHYRQSGHCYPELVEKRDGKVIAQMKSNLWKDDYLRINSIFTRVLKEPLKDGIKILFLAAVTFDSNHGLSLRIIDIDPSYSLGDLEREKQENLARLQEERIYRQNKYLAFPLLPQRIAIISVESSKGYADFLQVIRGNPWKYAFFLYLFPAILQGDNAVPSIIAQLRRIRKVKQHFDVVAIIRGGGGDIGLSCYNNYELAREIALFPLPVITGIGHATNETVSELISFSNAITPTKLADYLLQKYHDFSQPVNYAQEKILARAGQLISGEQTDLQSLARFFRSVTENMLNQHHNAIEMQALSLVQNAQFVFKNGQQELAVARDRASRGTGQILDAGWRKSRQLMDLLKKDALAQLGRQHFFVDQNSRQVARGSLSLLHTRQSQASQALSRLSASVNQLTRLGQNELSNLERILRNLSPENVLRRGYSITYFNGKALKDSGAVKEGDLVETVLLDGNISSIVASTNKAGNHE